jgi:regulator of protease activity HflC (stomatin/prohibitin superfamily)
LPLKQKQIEQSRLEAEARKEATVKNAEALAEAKVIDSKAELTKRNLMSESDEYHIRRVANADAERMKLEATARAGLLTIYPEALTRSSYPPNGLNITINTTVIGQALKPRVHTDVT